MDSGLVYLILALLGLIVFILIFRKRQLVRARGVEVDARCYDREWRGQGGPTFLLSFRTEDGRKMTCSATESEVPPGTRAGDTVVVRYDPAEPGRVETVIASRRPLWKRGDLIGLLVFEFALLVVALR